MKVILSSVINYYKEVTMEIDIREIIKNNLLGSIKEASTEEERYKAITNFHTFVSALHIEVSISEYTE